MKYLLGIPNFLKEISSLSHSAVFLYFLALITEEGFLYSPCYSLELCIQMGVSFLFSFTFCFFSQLFVSPPQTTILPFCISFSWGWSWSLPPKCHKPPFIVHSALCLSDLIPWIYLSFLLNNCKGFDLNGLVVLPTFTLWLLAIYIYSSLRFFQHLYDHYLELFIW